MFETDALISVIIPVYKVENYIRECMDSVLAQTYINLEIIAVDDGSPDNSGRILDEYAGLDSRVKVIHQDNGGLSAARNVGLDHATGQYICFIDSDDCIAPGYIEKLYAPIKGKTNVFSYCDYSSEWPLPKKDGEAVLLTKEEFKSKLTDLIAPEYVTTVVAWNKLYSRDIWNELSFAEGRYHEDEGVIYDVILRSKEIYYIPASLYYYRRRPDSITGESLTLEKKHLDTIFAYENRIEKAINYGDMDFAEICIRNTLYKLLELISEFGKNDKDARNKLSSEYKRIYKRYSKYLNIKRRLKYKIFSFKL